MVPAAAEGGEGARMAHASHEPRRPPASDEEADEMRRPEQPDLRGREAEREPRERVERADPAGGKLQQDDLLVRAAAGEEAAAREAEARRLCEEFGFDWAERQATARRYPYTRPA